MYRTALAARREHLVADEALTWVEFGPDVLAFRRGSGVLCVVNYGDEIEMPPGEVIVSSHGGTDALPTDTCAWIKP